MDRKIQVVNAVIEGMKCHAMFMYDGERASGLFLESAIWAAKNTHFGWVDYGCYGACYIPLTEKDYRTEQMHEFVKSFINYEWIYYEGRDEVPNELKPVIIDALLKFLDEA